MPQSIVFLDRLTNLVELGCGKTNHDILVGSIARLMGVVPTNNGIQFNDGSEVNWPEIMEIVND